MSVRYTVTVRCDDRRAPGCVGQWQEHHDRTAAFEHINTRLMQAGWDSALGYDRRHTPRDLCPACAAWTENALRPVPHERQPG